MVTAARSSVRRKHRRYAALKDNAPRYIGPQSTVLCHYYSTASSAPREIAVIGGGITGLSAAYWLTKKAPDAQVTLYEAGSRLGGWVRSTERDVHDGKVVFESGPRTLRTGSVNAEITLSMIKDLGLKDEVIFTPKNVPAAKNRYIYYPDHLVRLPAPGDSLVGALWNIIREPVFNGLPSGIVKELGIDPRDTSLMDESVASFMTRRIGRQPTDNLVSSMLHGIYAGDVGQLSVKSIFPVAWAFEQEDGCLLNGALRSVKEGFLFDTKQLEFAKRIAKYAKVAKEDEDFHHLYKKSSVYSLNQGLQQLNNALEQYLRTRPNVSIQLNTGVQDLQLDRTSNKVKLTTPNHDPVAKDMVISSIFSKTLAKMCSNGEDKNPLPSLLSTHAVTVMVVNLFFPTEEFPRPEGFGYLIPRSVPFEQNPERALGVIFDTDAVRGQDTAEGTKLTVMMGGHYWDDWSSYPSEDDACSMALDLLRRHLGNIPDPIAMTATLQENCIPQYTVGHTSRMKTAHFELARSFGGRLRVAGNSYEGVGVHDCTKSAFEVTEGIGEWFGGKSAPKTGLDGFVQEPVYRRVGMMDFRKGNF